MWGDRELEEKNVYDHGKESLYDHGKENGGVNGGGGMYQVEVPSMEQMESDDAVAVAIAAAAAGGQPIYSGLHELTAGAASNSASGASGTSGSSSMHQIDYRTGAEDHSPNSLVHITGNGGPSVLDPHSHATLAMDHHLHQMDNGNGGYMLDHLDLGNNSDFVGGPFGDGGGAVAGGGHNETSMMMMLPNSHSVAGRGVIVSGMDASGGYATMHHPHHHLHHSAGGGAPGDHDLKLPSAKPRENYLKKYARKLGVNDRGCYIACGLAVLAFLLFIVIIAMASAWPASRFRHTGPLEYCARPPCLEAAAEILAKQNTSYDACGDFWQFACGGWLSAKEIPPSKSRWSAVEELEYSLRREKARLITTTSHEPSQFNSIEWKIQNFYQSCMSLGFIESDREKPLLKIINSLGGWNVLRSFNLYDWDSHRVLRELHAEHYVNAFFRIGVDHDPSDPSSSRSIIKVFPAGLGMADKSYYQHRLPDDPAVQAYQTFMKDSAQLFGASSPEAHKFSVDIFNFEKRISEITPESEYLRDPVKTNNRMTVKDLHTMSMNIPWLEILKAAYSDAPMSEETEVIVASPQYAADIAVIMSTTDRASLNNYFMWQLVQAYMPYLSKQYREVSELYRKTLTGAQKPLERWEMCEITTERFFGHLLNVMFFRHLERDDAGAARERQPLAQKLFDYIKHNVAKSVSVSDGYDYASRRAAMSKLKNMTVQVGTPRFLLDRQYLKLMYKDLLVQKSDFFQNIQYGVIFLRKREEFALVSPGEESRWLGRLNDARVGYSPTGNKVIVPELWLRPPLFHPGYPNSVNLGGLGVALSEAVISGVVDLGLLFDARGVLRHPSANGSMFAEPLLSFERSSQCLQGKYALLGVDTPDHLSKCRASSAVSVAAARQTLLTLEDMLEMEAGQVLPAMEASDPQSLFFLAHAQSLCAKRTFKRRDIDRTTSGSYHRDELLEEERLEGTLSQIPEFRHYFFCSGLSDSTQCGSIV